MHGDHDKSVIEFTSILFGNYPAKVDKHARVYDRGQVGYHVRVRRAAYRPFALVYKIMPYWAKKLLQFQISSSN